MRDDRKDQLDGPPLWHPGRPISIKIVVVLLIGTAVIMAVMLSTLFADPQVGMAYR